MAIPKDFDPNKSSGSYMKFQPGDNKFRILGDAIAGYEWWVEKKPTRRRLSERIEPSEIPLDQTPKLFLAFPVWNYATESVEVLQLTQKGLQKTLNNLEKDTDWGDLTQYDIKVNRSGSGMETKYSLNPVPKKELAAEIKSAWKETDINLDALFTGDSPFGDF
jgi:hypothetical protein